MSWPYPSEFSSIHPVFHVSMLRCYILNGSHVLHWDLMQLDERLTFVDVPVAILAKNVRRLRSNNI